MCEHRDEDTRCRSAKTAAGWIMVDEALIAFDHATHAWLDHAIRIDFTSTTRPDTDRVAVELDLASGKVLLKQLEEVIGAAELSGVEA